MSPDTTRRCPCSHVMILMPVTGWWWRHIGDSGEAERLFRREAERHSGMIPNTIGA
jgi:hypothetical protein